MQKGESFPDKSVVVLRTKFNSGSCSGLAKMVLEVVQDRPKWGLRLLGARPNGGGGCPSPATVTEEVTQDWPA